ncbi:MAG: radical SAM protein [Deltaproteobacteria bacterium]|nr:radical SAM protein [Deltaproteobacteria bacterium]
MNRMQRVLLVNPHETEQLGFSNPPLGLLYIAGTLLKHGIDVRIVDGCREGRDSIRKAIEAFHPEMVGITCLTPGRKKALDVALMAKEFDSKTYVVMGGAHATIMHKQLLANYPSIDCIVIGEGEQTCLELAQGINPNEISGIAYRDGSGKIITNPPRKYVEDLDVLPFPAWHLIDLHKYPARNDGHLKVVNGVRLDREPRISVIFSRGCKGRCTFCSTWWIWRGWRRRSPKNMVDEIELLYEKHGIRHFCFADDAMTVDKKAAIELCDEIIHRNLKIAFHCTTRSDCVDEHLLGRLKSAGCYCITYGIETASPMLLDKMNKENDIESATRAIEQTKKAGILATALLIVGSVGETDETVGETIAFIKNTRPNGIGIAGSLWILPGTKLYQDCRRVGFIDDDFWLSDEPYKVYTLEHDFKRLRNYARRIMWHGIGPRKLAIQKLKNILNLIS